MRIALIFATLVVVSIFGLAPSRSLAQEKGAAALPVRQEYAPDRVIVCFKSDIRLDARIGAVQRLGLAPAKGEQSPFFATLQIPAGQLQAGDGVAAAVAALRNDPTVRYAEPVYYRYGTATPNDADFTKLWGLQNTGQVYRDPAKGTAGADIDAPEAWDRIKGAPGNSVKVAVIDSGVDYNHPDIRPNYYFYDDGKVSGWDFVDNDNTPLDPHGHGTHVAGTIGAQGNNSIGVVGVCHDLSLVSLRVLDANNKGTTDNIIKGIDWARNNGCRIVNLSLGSYTFSQAEHDACLRARDAGLLLVAAAGNDGADVNVDPHYPACYRDTLVLSVAASNSADEEPDFTNIGATNVDLFAPGVDIYSTRPGNRYQFLDGTSMATPHVTGAAALLLASEPGLSRAALRSRILDMADPIDAFAGRCVTGGRLNVFQMLGDRWERDNTWQTAQVLTQNVTAQERTFHVAEDEDWYKINATGTFELTVETDTPLFEEDTGGRTAIYLFGSDPTGSYIELSNPGGWATLSRTGARRLPRGTYYILIDNGNTTPLRGYRAEIRVRFGYDDTYEVDDTRAAAKLITPSSEKVRSIHVPGNDDWAKFVLTKAADVTIETRQAADGPVGKTELHLYPNDPASGYLDFSRPNGWGKIVRSGANRLAPGTYYILLREDFNDDVIDKFELVLTVNDAFYDSYEDDDERNKAKLITPTSSKLRSIHLPNNDDWAKIVLTKAADVTIETRQATGGPVGKTELHLYPNDPASGYLDFSRPNGWAKIVRSGANRLAPGTYYILLRENFSDDVIDKFELVLTVKEAFYDSYEADDTRDTAKLITPASSKIRSIHYPGNDDWAKFVLTNPSDVTIETRQATGGPVGKTELYLYPSDPASGYWESSRPDGWAKIERFGMERLAPGTYYILLRENFHDDVVDKFELVLNINEGEPDAFEADDTWQQAKVIPRGASQVRSIHQQGNQDWAKFTLSKAADVTIQTAPETGAKTVLYLYGDNPGGGYMDADDPDGAAAIERKGDRRLAPGTYYIQVAERFNDEPIDFYRLNLLVTDGPVDAFEVDDTWQQAKSIATGQSQARTIHQQGNQDWAKFTLTVPSAVTINTTSTVAGAQTVLYLFGDNPDGGYIDANDPAGLARIERNASNHLEPGTYYILVNERFNDGVLDNYKLELTVTALPRPPKPGNFKAQAPSAFEVALTWTDPAKNEQGFLIQRKDGDKGVFADLTQTGPNVTTFLDSSVAPKTKYIYQVRTVGESVSSEWAGPAAVTTPPNKPNKPTNLTAVAVNPVEIHLEWADNSNDEVLFQIERKIGNGAYAEIQPPVPHNVPEYNDNDVKPDTKYTYRVKAVGNEEPSEWSNEATVTTSPASAPDLAAAWGPIKFKPGKSGKPGKLTGSFTVQNIGDVASVPTKIRFYKSNDGKFGKDDVQVFEMDVPALKPGKSWKKKKKNPKFTLQVPNGKGGGSALKGLRAILFVDPIPPNTNREKQDISNNIAATGPLP